MVGVILINGLMDVGRRGGHKDPWVWEWSDLEKFVYEPKFLSQLIFTPKKKKKC